MGRYALSAYSPLYFYSKSRLFQNVEFFNALRLKSNGNGVYPIFTGNIHARQAHQIKIFVKFFGEILQNKRFTTVAHHRFIRLYNVTYPRKIILFHTLFLSARRTLPQNPLYFFVTSYNFFLPVKILLAINLKDE